MRRVKVNDALAGTPTTRYYYDGVNEVAEYDGSGNRSRTYVHGISYVDERLMMHSDQTSRPYYYAIDRMYNVVMLIDRAGAIVERYCYDAYGRPYIRESCGRGDMDDNTIMNSTDTSRFTAAKNGTIWDPRADLDDDGDVDANDQTLYDAKSPAWGRSPTVTVAQAFSDVSNPYMFQGVPQFALDTAADATSGKIMLNHHRARFEDVAIGRWLTRDPLKYNNLIVKGNARKARDGVAPYLYLASNGLVATDPQGLVLTSECYEDTPLDPSNPSIQYPGATLEQAAQQHAQRCFEDESAFCDQIWPPPSPTAHLLRQLSHAGAESASDIAPWTKPVA